MDKEGGQAKPPARPLQILVFWNESALIARANRFLFLPDEVVHLYPGSVQWAEVFFSEDMHIYLKFL